MAEDQNNPMVPFGQQRSLMAVDPAAVAAGEAVKARIQAGYIMAIQNPRNEDQARAKILRLCERPEFAEKVEYAKPIGKNKVKGLSIRFAEPALMLYRNITIETQLLYEDDNIKRLKVTALDLEGNTGFSRDISIKKTVERKSKKNREDDYISERKNSYGDMVYLLRATEDEVMTKESAWVSKFIRTEGLRLIPADIKEEATRKARAVLAQRDKEDPNAAKKRIIDAFTGLNIWPTDIERYIGHSVDTISPAEIADMRTIYSAIESGEATWADYIGREKGDPKARGAEPKKPTQDIPESGGGKEPEPEKPKTNPAFAAMVKKEAGKDFEYVPTGDDGMAHDLLSAYLESVAKNQTKETTPYEIMESVSEPGIFPGFWNGFKAGTWQHHFDGTLPVKKEPQKETQKQPESFQGHRPSQEGPSPDVNIDGSKKEESAGGSKPPEDESESTNPFDVVNWKTSGMKKVGLSRFWNGNKDTWANATEKGKAAFEDKWITVFTDDGVLTIPCPWKAEKQAAPDTTGDMPKQPIREPGDEPEDTQPQNEPIVGNESTEQPEKIDYSDNSGMALFAQIQMDDLEGLLKACEEVGYGKQDEPVIPLSQTARQMLHEKYLELKG